MVTETPLSYTGFAIDWGDLTSGNELGSYHIGDGTPATNVVIQPTSPAEGPSGAWGPVTHTYAQPGSYRVCAIIYDLGQTKPFLATGFHSLKATGTSHNSDNSVDNDEQDPALCATLAVTDPTPSPFQSFGGETSVPFQSFQGETSVPFQSFQGETSNPTATPPTTASDGKSSTPDESLPLLAVALLLASMLTSVFVLRTVRVRS